MSTVCEGSANGSLGTKQKATALNGGLITPIPLGWFGDGVQKTEAIRKMPENTVGAL
jgi:hypothetical protein